MRKSTIFWLLLAALCSYSLFYVSEKVRDVREDLASISSKRLHEEENIRVLKAEWSYLNQPKRLEALAKKHLHTRFVRINQFVKMEDISFDKPLIKNMSMPIRIKRSIARKIIRKKPPLRKIIKEKSLTANTNVKSKNSGFINMLHFWGRD